MEDKEVADRELIKTWFTRARAVENLDELNALMKDMMAYEHDYGTIVEASVAAALGAVWCIDNSPRGGITGFQAGFIGMSFLGKWLHIDGPWRRVEYSNMLFPQYKESFEKTLSPETMTWLQEQAKEKLAQDGGEPRPELKAHWISLAEGKPPFDYTVSDD